MRKSKLAEEKLRYDVAIVGAGPAGVSAAIASIKAGGTTILVERNPRLWYTSTSAAMVEKPLPFKEYVLEEIDKINVYAPHIIHQIDVGGAVIDYPRWLIDKVNEAGEIGVDVVIGASGSLKVTGGRVKGITIQSGPWAREIDAACVIDAAGAQHSDDAKISSEVLPDGKGIENVLYEFGNVKNASASLLFSQLHAPGGLAWSYPSAPGRAVAGLRHIKGTEIALRQLVTYHKEMPANQLYFSKPFRNATLNAYAITFSPGALLKKTYSAGLIVAGAAAGHAYPLRITNLELAMESGTIAGRAAAKYGATKKYEVTWKARFGRGLVAAYDLYEKLHRELYDAKMDELVRLAHQDDKSAEKLLECLLFSGDMREAARLARRFPDFFKFIGR